MADPSRPTKTARPADASGPRALTAAALTAGIVALGVALLAGTDPVPGRHPAASSAVADADAVAVEAPDAVDDELAAALGEHAKQRARIAEAAEAQGADPYLVLALAWHESRWQQDARSERGAIGVMQVLPATVETISEHLDESLDAGRVDDNVTVGALYLSTLEDELGSTRQALVAYNQGPVALREDGPLPAAERFADEVIATREALSEVRWAPADR